MHSARRGSAVIALVLVAIASARIISTYRVLSHTIDEPAHMGAGMEWLEAHRYTFENQHPPLARVAGALGLELGGIHWSGGRTLWEEGFRLLGRGEQYSRARFYGRLGMLPFFWLASLVVYLWTLRAAGPLAATFATLLFTSLPPVLAHAGLVTTDMALTATTASTVFVSLLWREKGGWRWNAVFGLCLGLAVLSKFSSLVFLPVAWLAMWMAAVQWTWTGIRHSIQESRRLANPALIVLAVACLVVWAGYRFTFHQVSYLHVPLPAPAFFTGVKAVWDHNSKGHEAYLLGRLSMTGFWYYYPVVLLLKTPIAMLILVVAAVTSMSGSGGSLGLRLPLAMAFGILFVSLVSHINIGVRHILPVYVGFSVVCGIVCARVWTLPQPRWFGQVAVCLLLTWFLASGAMQHPEYISYMNEIAGDHPEDYLVDSDLDWLQDFDLLATRLKRDHVQQIWSNCDVCGGVGNLPVVRPIPDGPSPSPGWTAVSITMWKLRPRYAWIAKIRPTERIGRSLLLYYVPPKY